MAEEEIDDAEASLLLIDVTETSEEMKSPFSKRRKLSSPTSETSYKRCPIINPIEYKSPLIHLGKNNSGNSSLENLDESIVVIHERIHFTPLKTSASSHSENKQPAFQDDSVIILSENEEEFTNPSFKIDHPESKEISSLRKKRRKLSLTSLKGRVRAKTVVKRIPLPRRQPLVTKLHSISIDSEDENMNSNKDLSETKSQAAVVSISDSPSIKTDVNVPNKNTTQEEGETDVNSSSHISESANPSLATPDDVSIVWMATEGLRTASEQLEVLNSAEKISECKNCPVLFADTRGDQTGVCRINAKRKLAGKSRKRKRKQQNPNWASFVKNDSPVKAKRVVKKQNRELNQPVKNAIGRYYTKERLVKGPGSLRDIVIDGCNIAMSYTNGKFFSEDGLKLVIDYFKLRGHTVRAFVPQHMRSFKHNLLEKLNKEGIVVFTPSRRIGGKLISSYDDRYILDYATMCDGIVVSLDQYRDLYKEKPEWKTTIEKRLLVPTFVGNCVMFPEDPLGRDGPQLENFLRH